jgi:hypothetical protein
MQILGGGMSTKMWEATVEHAETCVLTDKVHYYYPDSLNKAGVVFNVVGEVRGLISDKFVPVDDLTEKEKVMFHHFKFFFNKFTRLPTPPPVLTLPFCFTYMFSISRPKHVWL